MPGTTARLDSIHAAVLRVKLRRLDGVNEARRGVAERLTSALAGSGLTLPAPVPEGHDHVYHQYVVATDARDALREHLAGQGVSSAIHYPVAIHSSEAYATLETNDRPLPVSEALADRILSLPMYPGMSDDDVARIAAAVQSFEG
jgi:dTDP-4-amino-4,6-dideoxygalactose transaminase